MSEVPSEAYEKAARAYDEAVNAALRNPPPGSVLGANGRKHLAFRAAVESAYETGRMAASAAIQAHADRHAPLDGNSAQRTLRRHLLTAARVAEPPITLEQAAALLKEALARIAEDGHDDPS